MTKDFVMKTLERWINARYELWNYEVVSLGNKRKEITIRFKEKEVRE